MAGTAPGALTDRPRALEDRMPLPATNITWPPQADAARYHRINTSSVWYAGDPTRLAGMYAATSRTKDNTQHRPGILGQWRDWFWGTQDPSEPMDKLHLPVAQALATKSSDLLFSQPPRFVVQPVEFDAQGKVPDAHQVEVDAAQARLNKLLDDMGWESTLPEAAEVCAALGTVGLRISYSVRDKQAPAITRVDADAMLGEWNYGRLQAVLFWSVVRRESKGETVWRHLERHTPGQIEHGLYKGTPDMLGQRQPLTALPTEMAWAIEAANDEGVVALPEGVMTARAVPNMLPDPLDRTNRMGRSDWSPGVLGLFDSIDRAYSSLMRDIDDGKSRLLIAESMLENLGAGHGVAFNQDQHIFTKLSMPPQDGAGSGLPIESVQFKIRVEEHLRTLDWLVGEAFKDSGYSTDTELGDGQVAMTATEYEGRAKRDMNTRKKKLTYWAAQLQPLMENLLAIDALEFRSGIRPLPVVMEAAPPVPPSDKAQADVVESWSRSESASLTTRVQALHPDWSPAMVEEEVQRIREEGGLADPDASPGSNVQGAELPDTIDSLE